MSSAPNERRSMTFRMPRAAIDLIDRAATRLHKDRTAFIVEAASERAQEVLLDQVVFPLSADAHDAFLAALDDPPEPNARLRALMAQTPPWES